MQNIGAFMFLTFEAKTLLDEIGPMFQSMLMTGFKPLIDVMQTFQQILNEMFRV